jgi:hypothetical protein
MSMTTPWFRRVFEQPRFRDFPRRPARKQRDRNGGIGCIGEEAEKKSKKVDFDSSSGQGEQESREMAR